MSVTQLAPWDARGDRMVPRAPCFGGIPGTPMVPSGHLPACRGREAPRWPAGCSSWGRSATRNQTWVTLWQIAPQQGHPAQGVTKTWLPGDGRGQQPEAVQGGEWGRVCTHRGHRTPWVTGAVALVVVEPQGVAVPRCSPLHLHDHLLRPRGDLQPGHCARGGSGHTASSTTRPAPWHRAWHPGGHPHPQHPPHRAPQGTRAKVGGSWHRHGQGMPALTLALGDSSLCRGPRAVCGDRGSVGGETGDTAAGHAGGSPGTRCRWLNLRRLCELVYAVTWSSEPSGASKHRKVTQPWAGKPPPRCGEALALLAPTSPGHGEWDHCAMEMCLYQHPPHQAPQCLGHPPVAPHTYVPGVGQAPRVPWAPRPPRPRSARRRTCARRAAADR